MNLRIVFKFKDCKLQFYEKRRLFSYFSVNPRTPASRWRRLLKLKRININSFKIIIGFFFTPPLFLATKVAISFVYYSPKTIICTQKPKIEKKSTGIDQSSERASECHSHIISITRSCACAQKKEKEKLKRNLLSCKHHRPTTGKRGADLIFSTLLIIMIKSECNVIDIHANLLACVLAKNNQRSLLLNMVHGTLAKIIIRELTPPFALRNHSPQF